MGNRGPAGVNPHVCPYCDREHGTRDDLIAHLFIDHATSRFLIRVGTR